MIRSLAASLAISMALAILGFPAHAAQAPQIIISRPSEGETLYAGPSTLIYSIQVTGWILGVDDLDGVDLNLEIIRASVVVGRLDAPPSSDGSFSFSLTVNPEGSSPNFNAPQVESGCENCHFRSGLDLPSGELVLRVSAALPDGDLISQERRITVDRSGRAVLPVHVVRTGPTAEPVEGVVVEASSRLYEWRARVWSGTTDEAGNVSIGVEALSEAPTRYIIKVMPSVKDGMLFEGTAPMEVVLPPRSTSYPTVILEAGARTGLIAGRAVDSENLPVGSVDVWAIDQADLRCYQTATNKGGGFAIRDLPMGSYTVAADPAELAEAGIAGDPQTIDLASTPRARVTLKSHELPEMLEEGAVLEEGGDRLPFFEVKLETTDAVSRSSPVSRTWSAATNRLPATMVVSAPGYYSRRLNLDDDLDSTSTLDIRLNRRSETRSLAWGDGEIVLPSESHYTVEGNVIDLQSGWIWGTGGGQAISLHTPSMLIDIESGSFAVELGSDSTGWVYVYEGVALTRPLGGASAASVHPGEVVRIGAESTTSPVPVCPILDIAVAAGPRPSIPVVWEPNLIQIQINRIRDLGVSAAMIITLVTYSLGMLLLVLLPLLAISSLRRRL